MRLGLALLALAMISILGGGQIQAQQLPVPEADSSASIVPILSLSKNKFRALPVMSRSPETRLLFGALLNYTFKTDRADSNLRTSSAQLLAAYTTRRQIVIMPSILLFMPRENWVLMAYGLFRRFPDYFYGIGQTSRAADRESYNFTSIGGKIRLQRRVWNKIFAGPFLYFDTYRDMEREPGGLFEGPRVLGADGFTVAATGLNIAFDNRDNIFGPYRGHNLEVEFFYSQRAFGSDFNYARYHINLRKYLPLPRRQVIAIQLLTEFVPGQVPFCKLPAIGGASLLRGYYEGRFRDQNMLVAQTEWRVPIWWRISGAAFVGAGQVAQHVADYQWQRTVIGGGGGLRFAIDPEQNLNVRFDVGVGEGIQLYFGVTEAF